MAARKNKHRSQRKNSEIRLNGAHEATGRGDIQDLSNHTTNLREDNSKEAQSPQPKGVIKKPKHSHWIERTLFIIGSLMLFSSEQIFTK
jgi:hypothetical protein